VVTNCSRLPSEEFIDKAESFGFKKGVSLFFTGLEYLAPYDARTLETVDMDSISAYGISGIASDSGFQHYICSHYHILGYRRFGDHHRYADSDFKNLPEGTRCIITTEKDAVKLRLLKSLAEVRILALPIRVKFLEGEENLKILISQRLNHPH